MSEKVTIEKLNGRAGVHRCQSKTVENWQCAREATFAIAKGTKDEILFCGFHANGLVLSAAMMRGYV